MAGWLRLAAVPEDSITAPYPPCNSYRESIRGVRVLWPERHIGSTRSSQSGQTGSTNSSISAGSTSYQADFSTEELTEIAQRMMSDGYTQRVIEAFGDGDSQDRALENWFVELDVEWVLEVRGGFGLKRQVLQNTSSSGRQELIERWIRALTVIAVSIKKADFHNTLAAARFGKASISAMVAAVAPILDVLKAENLQPMVHMYICVSGASYGLDEMHVVASEAQIMLNEIGALLEREEKRLIETMSTSLSKMRMSLVGRHADGDADDSWVVSILRGGGEIHNKTRLLVGNIMLMRKAHDSVQNSTPSRHKTESLRCLIHGTIGYTKDLLLRKSELCGDLSLRYLFRLNNSYFVAQEISEPSALLDFDMWSRQRKGLELTPECERYMDSYLDVSWGHALSYILKSNSPGESKQRKKASSLAKFHSAFHKTYQTQKFWKVPDPQLRSLLQETITKRVISGYCAYLIMHPELEKQIRGGCNSPEVMEEMLEELFEG